MKIVSYFVLFFSLFSLISCEQSDFDNIPTQPNEQDYVKINLEVKSNDLLGTRARLEGIKEVRPGHSSGTSFDLDRGWPFNCHCYISYDDDPYYSNRKTTFKTEHDYALEKYLFDDITFNKDQDPSKIKLHFLLGPSSITLNHYLFDLEVPFFSSKKFYSDVYNPLCYGEFYLADENDWSKVKTSFTLENYTADFVVFSDEFWNTDEQIQRCIAAHTLDYTPDRDVSEYLRNQNSEIPFSVFYYIEKKFETNSYNYIFDDKFGNNVDYSPLMKEIYSKSWGCDFDRNSEDYHIHHFLIDDKKYDAIGRGTIIVPDEDGQLLTGPEQPSPSFRGNETLKYLVLLAKVTYTDNSIGYYKAVIPLSSLNLQRNCLYIIKNKNGSKILTRCDDSTRSGENSCLVDLEDITIEEITK